MKMKMKFLMIIMGLFSIFSNTNNLKAEDLNKGFGKVLIAYYSRSGNTKEVAEYIKAKTNGTLFKIETIETYPEEYKEMTELAKEQIKEGYLPELKSKVEDIEEYDVIFIGSPNWWGTISLPVSSFLKEHNLKGKTVIPFITHGGGYIQNTFSNFSSNCEGCEVKKGFITAGSNAKSSKDDLDAWLNKLDF